MHSAPSVSYPVGRSRFALTLLSGTWLAGALTTALWCLQAGTSGWRMLAAAAALVLAGGAAGWNWWRSPVGTLAWDGESWTWVATSGQEDGDLAITLDLQRCVLVRWTDGVASRWLWVERAACAQRWGDLRRAVYSRAKSQALRPADPPAANT